MMKRKQCFFGLRMLVSQSVLTASILCGMSSVALGQDDTAHRKKGGLVRRYEHHAPIWN